MKSKFVMGLLSSFAIPLLSIASAPPPVPDPAPPIVHFSARVIAEGLTAPDGLAVHPTSGELYVAEEDAGRISVIRGGKAVPVITDNWRVTGDLPSWMPATEASRAQLRNPEGIAFGPAGQLYVVEDIANGRVLEFVAGADGKYSEAHVLAPPWLKLPISWEGVCAAKDGTIYVCGASRESAIGPYFGSVLRRSPAGEWTAIDYGPFAAFSSVSLSRDDGVLVVAEEITGSVIWWDVERRMPIDATTNILNNIESATVLPDGSILTAQELDNSKGSIRRLDPSRGTFDIALEEGLGSIETIAVSPDGQHIYVSEDGSGRILELTPDRQIIPEPYLLEKAMATFEHAKGLPGKACPGFVKGFFNRMGVDVRDGRPDDGKGADAAGAGGGKKAYTLQDMAQHLPFIAGSVKTQARVSEGNGDPVSQVDFMVFFPTRVVKNGSIIPSLSLFSAKHHSGKRDDTRVLENFAASQRNADGTWTYDNRPVHFFLPLTVCSVDRNPMGSTLSLVFLGLGQREDYYLTFNLGRKTEAYLVVDGQEPSMASYEVDFTDIDPTTGEEVMNLVVAMSDKDVDDQDLWLDLARSHRLESVMPGSSKPWMSHWLKKHNPEFLALFKDLPVDRPLKLATPAPKLGLPDDHERMVEENEGSEPVAKQPEEKEVETTRQPAQPVDPGVAEGPADKQVQSEPAQEEASIDPLKKAVTLWREGSFQAN